MKHGELGLGGLEEEIITQPRISPFALADKIVQGILLLFVASLATKLVFFFYKFQLAVEIIIQS